jgi:hypothetical protein
VHYDPTYGPSTAVFLSHLRPCEEELKRHLDDLGLHLRNVEEHYDDVDCRRQVDPRKDTHGKDVHVEPAIVLTLCRGRRGGAVHCGNEHRLTFVHEEQGVLDALALSSVSQTLENKCCCPEQKEVSR